jgi:hypothetical protein
MRHCVTGRQSYFSGRLEASVTPNNNNNGESFVIKNQTKMVKLFLKTPPCVKWCNRHMDLSGVHAMFLKIFSKKWAEKMGGKTKIAAVGVRKQRS